MDLDYHSASSASVESLFQKFQTSLNGLSDLEASARLGSYGPNELLKKKSRMIFLQVISKFLNPLVVLLLIIGVLSLFFKQEVQAFLILMMILMSALLSFFQEYRSGKEAEKLRQMIHVTAAILRNGREQEIPIREIVPGDIVDLNAGDMIPADIRLLSCKDFFMDQSSLTGESFPVEKQTAATDISAGSVFDLPNILLMGSSVVSGTALGLVVKTGASTKFGQISERLSEAGEATSFDKGIRQFVWLMIFFIVVLVTVIFVINITFKGNLVEALLFSLAVAVGLTPEMLPMVIAVNLSKGAIAMSKKKVIVKRLSAIQNLGAMNVLCADKTGTLTMNHIILEKHCDVAGKENEEVFHSAYLNSFHQTGLKNLLDQAILAHDKISIGPFKKIDEIPFDFSRRLMSVVLDTGDGYRMISKGAAEEIFKRCTHYELDGETHAMEGPILSKIREEHDKLSADGFRVLAVAYKNAAKKEVYSKEDECGMTLKGYVAFLDPPKSSAREIIERLEALGIRFVVLTGDNELVTKKICHEVSLDIKGLMTGDTLEAMSDEELDRSVLTHAVFTRLSPMQKERVIRSLRRNNSVVGYLGDGINDALSLKAADVGISVDNAVDIAKESADIILLEKNLMVLAEGVVEGRKTFANTMKYVRMGASSNLGNMISMAGASLFLPFLPMTPIQILFNNFLYDISQIAIPTDDVDKEYLTKPRVWDIGSIRHFMLIFGPVSSLFDFVTFGVLFYFFNASQEMFHTGWFLESLVTEVFIIYVIRTAKVPVFESRPSAFLLFMGLLVVAVGAGISVSPLGKHFGFVAPSAKFFMVLAVIVLCYISVSQMVKSWYVKKYGY